MRRYFFPIIVAVSCPMFVFCLSLTAIHVQEILDLPRIRFDGNGELLPMPIFEQADYPFRFNKNNRPYILIRKSDVLYGSLKLTSWNENAHVFVYDIQQENIRLQMQYEISSYRCDRQLGIVQKISLIPDSEIKEDITLVLPYVAGMPSSPFSLFAPMKNGVGKEMPNNGEITEWLYYLTGVKPAQEKNLLAIPMMELYPQNTKEDESAARIVFAADPYFSTQFAMPGDMKDGAFRWTCESSKIPFDQPIQRTFTTIFMEGGVEDGLQQFYQTLDIPPGPAWLHDIAMVGYDYLSDKGQGWYKDIDWLTERLPKEDRQRICLALHGWYDILGRYTYNAKTKKLDSQWTAFPNASHCDKKVFPNSVSVDMSQEKVRERLRYAKERGFRVVLYFADGMAICEGAKEEFFIEKILYSGGWQGPDTIGPTHIMNPLHPAVREWFLGYMQALLETYGGYVDGFVWDETFHVDPEHYGTKYAPGYASHAMMTLTRELTESVHRLRPDCVFLASDCLGANGWNFKAPYALMADGTYQDSHCQPAAWPYGIFPNYRNVLWSCNWNPVQHFDWTEIGVRKYQAPVVFTNGWNDDMGFSEMPEATAQKFINLFQERKKIATRLKWIPSGILFQ
ncbi:MAG: hypothetical protein AB1656_19530 [Candidatus Omnitrophota bacterium]